jgi:predicted dehydrogenase
MELLRIGIIGAGGMGSAHIGHLTRGEVPGSELVAVADVDEHKLQVVRDTHPEVNTYGSADALMDAGGIDAIIIATPHYFHPPYAIQGLECGLHVMSEKPAGVYTKQVLEMNEAAGKSDRVFGIMFNQRTRPVHQKLRELVASGELGEIKRTIYTVTDWFRAQSYYDSGGWRATWAGEGGGALANQCPHNLDMWQWVCGMPVRVRAFVGFGKYHDIEVDDDTTAYVEYENGATGIFMTSTGEAPGTNRLEISADRGKVVMEDGRITFWRTRESVSGFLKEHPNGFGRPEIWECKIPVPDNANQEHVAVLTNWVDAIRNGTPLLAPGQEGINGVQLSNAMLLSTWLDDWVSIPVDEDLYFEKLQERIANSTVNKDPSAGKTMDVIGTF